MGAGSDPDPPRLVAPTSGTATFEGRRYDELRDPVRHVGAVLEASGFHPDRTAFDHLRVLATAARLAEDAPMRILRATGLADDARRRVGEFSLGMRQRLGLAAAILGDPAVLVLDEPTNGLDPQGVRGCAGMCASSRTRVAPGSSQATRRARPSRPPTTCS